MDVKDFARGLLDLAPKIERDLVNLVSGHGTTIKELAPTISEAASFRGKIFFNANRYTGAKEKILDATKLREKYKMEISADLAPGIRRTTEWFSKNFDALKDRRKFSGA
jgi:nucleoside-diphosphate-sugar epimerase